MQRQDKSKNKIYKNVKINYEYYQEHTLNHIFEYEILDLYPQSHESIELHQDKAMSYPSQSQLLFSTK